jgi:sugar/nucleoside kinase (ribokinase family)
MDAGEPVRRLDPSATPLLTRADLVGVSGDDLRPGTTMAGLCRFLRPGSTLLMTAGDRGGIVAEVGQDGPRRMHRYPAIPSERRVDPTGAGDVFLASVLAARARPGLVGGRLGQHHDLKLAAAVASLLVEAPGLDGVPDRAAVRRRLAQAGSAGRVE